MSHERLGWCFLRRKASPEQVVEALRTYDFLRGVTFETKGESHECSGPGFSIRITPVTKLKPLLAEVEAVGRRADELRVCSMVLVIDVEMNAGEYGGTAFSARAPFAPESQAVPAEYVGACEALNIKLAKHQPTVYDRISGFYPRVGET